MANALTLPLGLLLWLGVLWDGFATVVLPGTISSSRHPSGYFYRASWRTWAALSRRFSTVDAQAAFLSVYATLSVVLLLTLWVGLMILAFALIYHGLGIPFEDQGQPVNFLTLLYVSGTTFLTLGLGDVTTTGTIGRVFMLFETGSGFVFLGLIITYMPLLDQAYNAREVDNLLIQSRAGTPPSAVRYLHRYSGPDYTDILRANLHEAERWIATTLQSHLSHPVLVFYRAQHYGHSWLISLTVILDSCALLIAQGRGPIATQARLTFRIGLELLNDLSHALAIDAQKPAASMVAVPRLSEVDLELLQTAIEAARIGPRLAEDQASRLLRLTRLYDARLQAFSAWLAIPLPAWIPETNALTRWGGDTIPDFEPLPSPPITHRHPAPSPIDGRPGD
jgi:hypothetical protein